MATKEEYVPVQVKEKKKTRYKREREREREREAERPRRVFDMEILIERRAQPPLNHLHERRDPNRIAEGGGGGDKGG